MRRYERQVEEQLYRLRVDSADRLYSGREHGRYELLYRSLRDWERILGEGLHRPWAEVPARFDDLPDEVIEALPAAMAVARQPEEDVASTTLRQAYGLVYDRGWASRLFAIAHEDWEAEQGGPSGAGHDAVDLDSLDSDLGPRRLFRDYWMRGGPRLRAAETVRADIVRAAGSGDLALPNRLVRRLGRYSDGMAVPEPEYYRPLAVERTAFALDIFSAEGRVARRHYVDRSVAWLPDAARAGVHAPTMQLRASEGPTAVRVDLSERIPAPDLTLFSTPPDGAKLRDLVFDDRTAVEYESAPWH